MLRVGSNRGDDVVQLHRLTHLIDDVRAERAVAFELGLAEELVRRRLVRESRIHRRVVVHVPRLLRAVERGLDVDEDPVEIVVTELTVLWIRGLPIDHRVADPADRPISTRIALVLPGARINGELAREFDGDPEIDADLSHGISQILKGTRGIAARVAHYDEAVPA